MTVDARGRPAGSLEPFHLVDGIGKRQRAIDGDAVVVEQHNKFVEFQVACERDGFLAYPFHEVAIGSQHISVVIDDLAAENSRHMPLGYRHADRVGDPLAERTSRGFDAWRVAMLGMARRERTHLAEVLEFADG